MDDVKPKPKPEPLKRWKRNGVVDMADARMFAEAADAYAKEHMSTPEKARATLIRLGIIDENGELTKEYQSTKLKPRF